MTASSDEPSWPLRLYRREGAEIRLRGITVFHDFKWREVFRNGRTQFKNGMSLADLAKKHCPDGFKPALLLTREEGVKGRWFSHDDYRCLVVNIDHYLSESTGNAATTYFANLAPVDPVTVASIDLPELTEAQVGKIILSGLDTQLLRLWLSEDPGRVALLARLLMERAPTLGKKSESLQVAADALVQVLGEEVLQAWARAGKDLPEALAHAAIWRHKAKETTRFREHLDGVDWDERDWQKFFEENHWIFGYGLRPQFLHLLHDKPNLGGTDITGKGGQLGDFLLMTEAEVRFTVLVEIKRPDCRLLEDSLYRNRVYKLGDDLIGGVLQLQQQRWRWDNRGSRTDENKDLLESQQIFTHEPRSILVVGNTYELRGNSDKRRTFETFRQNLLQPEILTYDELLFRTEHMVETQLGQDTTDSS